MGISPIPEVFITFFFILFSVMTNSHRIQILSLIWQAQWKQRAWAVKAKRYPLSTFLSGPPLVSPSLRSLASGCGEPWQPDCMSMSGGLKVWISCLGREARLLGPSVYVQGPPTCLRLPCSAPTWMRAPGVPSHSPPFQHQPSLPNSYVCVLFRLISAAVPRSVT